MCTSEIRTTLLRSVLWTRLKWLCVLAFTVLFNSCSDDNWAVNPDEITLERPFKVRQFQNEVRKLPENDSLALRFLDEMYGGFWDDYAEDILKLGPSNEVSTIQDLRRFLAHPNTIETFAAIDSISGYESYLEVVGRELEKGFKRFHALMPNEPVPDIITMPSGFNYAIYPREDFVAIGLDWFLGPDHPIVGKLPPDRFPRYQQLRMHPDLMIADTFKGWLLVHFASRGYTGKQCVDDILYWGKILWIVDHCLPQLHDHLLMDWTPEDLAWAYAHETAIWIELQPQNVLFETNPMIFNRWLSDGPFTRVGAIPQESPDRLGIWMGWRIIEDYMDRHPDTTLDELLDEQAPLPFLKSYRPE